MAFEAKIREGLQPQGSLEVADVAIVICFGEAEDMWRQSAECSSHESHTALSSTTRLTHISTYTEESDSWVLWGSVAWTVLQYQHYSARQAPAGWASHACSGTQYWAVVLFADQTQPRRLQKRRASLLLLSQVSYIAACWSKARRQRARQQLRHLRNYKSQSWEP